ncbi:MAG: hypothetical protein IH984_17130 [Planctomycetes bacterium]|nr:hypothetical protein [Planctomycetota bacterium]
MDSEFISSTTNLVSTIVRHTIRFIQKPVVSVLFGVALFLDACSLGQGSTVGSIITQPLPRQCGGYYSTFAIIVEGVQGAELMDQESVSDFNLDEEKVIGFASCYPRPSYSGWWAITEQTHNATLRVLSQTRSFTLQEQQRLPQQFAELIEKNEWYLNAEYVDKLRSGGGKLRRILWSGYIHNVVATFLATAFLFSFGWLPKRIASNRREQAQSSGLCPECRYDLQGLAEEGCPECGWGREAEA